MYNNIWAYDDLYKDYEIIKNKLKEVVNIVYSFDYPEEKEDKLLNALDDFKYLKD